MMRTYKSSSFNAPIETAQLDEVQVERLDLGQHAVEGDRSRTPVGNVSSPFSRDTIDSRPKGRSGQGGPRSESSTDS
jgi:hypothetical protein